MAAADIADTAAGGTYLNAAAAAVTTDQKANVTAQANFDDAVSGEEITWVSTMAAASAAVYTGSMSDASYESTLQTASATRAAAIQNDNIPRVTAIGNAEITEATSLSGAGVTLAGSEGTDEEGLVSGLAGVANTLAGQEKSADTAFVSAVTGDATTFAEATAGDEQTDVSADDAAGVGYQQTAGDNEVTEANSVAGDDATYQEAIADQEESADQNFASEYPSGQNTETADFAQAFAQWISEVAGSFVSDSTTVAQDDATYQDALAVAGQALDNAQETANVAFVDADAPAQATETQGITAAQDTYAVDVANEVGTDAIATAGADATDDTTIATGDGAWTLALAQSDKAYQVAVAQNGGVDNSTITAARVAAVALAQENLTINVANADLAWITGKAAADEGFAVTDAGNWQTMIDGEATAVDSFAHTDDAAVKTADDAAGAAQAALMNAQAAADQAQENGDAGAEANFSEAEANDESSVMSGFASSMGTPWAQFEAALAAAQASEAQTEGNDLVAYVQALGLAEVNYTSNDAGQFTSEVQTIDAADKTSADSQADAWQTLVDTEAGDEATFETTMAPVVQGWQVATAQAADGDTVALAQALYNFTTGAISQSGYQTAVAAANAAQATADETANQTYSSAYGTTQSSQMTSDANANLAAVTATVNAILTDIKADAAAIDLYLDDESGYYDGEEKADAGALETYIIGVANAQAAAAESLEQSDPSPWAAQDAAAAAAQAAQIASQAAAQQTSTDSAADAEEASEIASSDAQLAQTDAQAQSWHDQALAMATGEQALALAQASSIGSQAAADAYFASVGATPLTGPGGDTPITLTGDYGNAHPIGAYLVGDTVDQIDGVISQMFVAPDGEPAIGPQGIGEYGWFTPGSAMPYGVLGSAVQDGLNMMQPGGAAAQWSGSPTSNTFGPQIFGQEGGGANGQPVSSGTQPPAGGAPTNPGTAELNGESLGQDKVARKAARWQEYQNGGGTWTYERWSKVYDLNQSRATAANAAVDAYHQDLGWGKREVVVSAIEGAPDRKLDIGDLEGMRGIEHKTGYQSATEGNLSEVARDAALVKKGWKIKWVFEGSASKPLLEALKTSGIEVEFRAVAKAGVSGAKGAANATLAAAEDVAMATEETVTDSTMEAAGEAGAMAGGGPIGKPGIGVAGNIALGVLTALVEAQIGNAFYKKGAAELNDIITKLAENSDLDDEAWQAITARVTEIQNMEQTWPYKLAEFISYGQGSLPERKGIAMSLLAQDLAKQYGYEYVWSLADAIFGTLPKPGSFEKKE